MGFDRIDVKQWFEKAGLKNVVVDCAEETCCAQSENENETARVSVFVASGEK
jgi:hypothetical protein